MKRISWYVSSRGRGLRCSATWQLAPERDVSGPLDKDAASVRDQPDPLQRLITRQRGQVWADELQRDVMLLLPDDERWVAYLSVDWASSELVRSFLLESHGCYTTSDEFAEMLCDYTWVSRVPGL